MRVPAIRGCISVWARTPWPKRYKSPGRAGSSRCCAMWRRTAWSRSSSLTAGSPDHRRIALEGVGRGGLCTCVILIDMDCRRLISLAVRDRNRLKGGLVCLLVLLVAGAGWLLRATGARHPRSGSSSSHRLPTRAWRGQSAPCARYDGRRPGGVRLHRDGRPDIFFTNGANLATLKRTIRNTATACFVTMATAYSGCHRIRGTGRHGLR